MALELIHLPCILLCSTYQSFTSQTTMVDRHLHELRLADQSASILILISLDIALLRKVDQQKVRSYIRDSYLSKC
jgi:hypothetical protein